MVKKSGLDVASVDSKWFQAALDRIETLRNGAKEYETLVTQVKEAAREIATKKDVSVKRVITKPSDKRTIVELDINGKYRVCVDIKKRPSFDIPQFIKAKYETDPITVKEVTWNKTS